MLSDEGKQALHQLRGWKETLTDKNMPVYEQTIDHFDSALERLAKDLSLDLGRFMIDAHELVSFSYNRSDSTAHDPDDIRYVVWHDFMSKLNGALSYIGERIANVPESSAPPIPRQSLRPVLRRLVEAYFNLPLDSTILWARETNDGLAVYPSFESEESVFNMTWGQFRELQHGGFIGLKRGQKAAYVRIPETGMDAYKEIVRLDDMDRPEVQPIERRAPMNNKVWVIHGHDHRARDVIFALLTAVGLQPLEFDQAAELTGKPSPSVMEILTAAFREGQAFVALFTPDEEAAPAAAFAEVGEPGPHPQPRPNVVLEAGMAFAYDPDRTVIVEMGKIREISDLGGSIRSSGGRIDTRRGKVYFESCVSRSVP